MDGGRATKPGETARFGRRREDVIHAASALINELGVKGTTFAELARSVGLNATSITYYFDRKDKLLVIYKFFDINFWAANNCDLMLASCLTVKLWKS